MPQTSVEHQREVRITQAERLAPARAARRVAGAGRVPGGGRPPGCGGRPAGRLCGGAAAAAGGLLLQAAGLLLLLGAGPGDSFLTGVAPGFILVGAGVPIAWVPLTAAAVDGADEHAGLASGLFNTAQQVGNAVALALLATVAATVTGALAGDHLPGPAELVAGYHAGFLTAATLCVLGLLAALRLPHPAAG